MRTGVTPVPCKCFSTGPGRPTSGARGAGVSAQREEARGEDPGRGHPRPARWGVPPDERAREEPTGPGAAIGNPADSCVPLPWPWG